MSHIQQQRNLNASNRKKIQALLGWDDFAYNEFMFEKAYEYLGVGMLMDYDWQNALTRTSGFWKFWINEWNLRNEHCFLPNSHEYADKEKFYRRVHAIKFINGHPSKKVFDEAYAIMVGETFDDIKKLVIA